MKADDLVYWDFSQKVNAMAKKCCYFPVTALSMALHCSPIGQFTGSPLDSQHRWSLPAVTDQGPREGPTKNQEEGKQPGPL